MKKWYYLLSLFFALSVKSIDLENFAILRWDKVLIVRYKEQEYVVSGRQFEKMRVNRKESEENPKYKQTPKEVQEVLRKMVQQKRNPKKIKPSSDSNKSCTII